MPDVKDRWFTFLMAITIALLTALGGMVLFLNSQTWTKLDRITGLFLHERDLLNTKMDGVCEKQSNLSERVAKIEAMEGGKK